MTVGELSRILSELDHDVEIRIANQPHWPFEYDVSTAAYTTLENYEVLRSDDSYDDQPEGWWVVNGSEDPQDNEYWVDGPHPTHDAALAKQLSLQEQHTPILYLAEGTQLGYLPREARAAIGW